MLGERIFPKICNDNFANLLDFLEKFLAGTAAIWHGFSAIFSARVELNFHKMRAKITAILLNNLRKYFVQTPHRIYQEILCGVILCAKKSAVRLSRLLRRGLRRDTARL